MPGGFALRHIFCLIGNIDFLLNKNAPRGNTLVRKEVTKVTRTRRGCFSEEKHFVPNTVDIPPLVAKQQRCIDYMWRAVRPVAPGVL